MREPAADEPDVDLHHHGDRDLGPDLVDLAVNVRLTRPPEWLFTRMVEALRTAGAYPDARAATAAVAARHGRPLDQVLVTAGAAEAFTLLARALAPTTRRAVVVHPQFTEPEAALRAAGHHVTRVVLAEAEGFRLGPAAVPADADLVVIGNPTNPTSVLHPVESLRALIAPGRVVVVDEAFLDAVQGEPGSLAAVDLPGLLVIRSLTKTWGIAGVRAGYVVGEAPLIARLAAAQPPWSVSSPALAAIEACLHPAVIALAEEGARATAEHRDHLLARLSALSRRHGATTLSVAPGQVAPFVLMRVRDGEAVRSHLRERGYAVRRGDTFPGLGPQWLRVAVRDPATSDAFAQALDQVLSGEPAAHDAIERAPSAGQGHLLPGPLPTLAVEVEPAAVWRPGHVVLLGAGPGDAGLLTVRGRELLGQAEVVITDRLVPRSSLAGLHPSVEVIDVSKTPRGHATPQERINELLIEHALRGRRVLRFKGGDPFVFGRGMEELEACAAAGLAVEVVPGISSAISVPELAGIPVTHRGLSQGFTVVSAHVPPGDPRGTIDWAALARSNTTLVLLMSVHTLGAVAKELTAHGMAATTPAACIENGTLTDQRVLVADLATVADVARDHDLRPPAITVIGAVAAFARATE